MLAWGSYSGYDLMQKIQPFWYAQHSQIYPLLAELERSKLVEFVLVPQSDKPDKKIYSITEAGKAALHEWIDAPSAMPVTRDEFSFKVYSVGITDRAKARKLVKERKEMYAAKRDQMGQKLELVLQLSRDKGEEIRFGSQYYGAYLLLHKAISNAKSNIEWCDWVEETLQG